MRSLNWKSLWLSLAFTASLLAQSDRGTVTGTVSDPGGAVIPGVSVEALRLDTGATYKTVTSETGNYALSQLPTGAYEISATLPGFKRYVRPNTQIGVAETLRIDVTLEIGAATESITVTE